jgi:hypothetical protein
MSELISTPPGAAHQVRHGVVLVGRGRLASGLPRSVSGLAFGLGYLPHRCGRCAIVAVAVACDPDVSGRNLPAVGA